MRQEHKRQEDRLQAAHLSDMATLEQVTFRIPLIGRCDTGADSGQ